MRTPLGERLANFILSMENWCERKITQEPRYDSLPTLCREEFVATPRADNADSQWNGGSDLCLCHCQLGAGRARPIDGEPAGGQTVDCVSSQSFLSQHQ